MAAMAASYSEIGIVTSPRLQCPVTQDSHFEHLIHCLQMEHYHCLDAMKKELTRCDSSAPVKLISESQSDSDTEAVGQEKNTRLAASYSDRVVEASNAIYESHTTKGIHDHLSPSAKRDLKDQTSSWTSFHLPKNVDLKKQITKDSVNDCRDAQLGSLEARTSRVKMTHESIQLWPVWRNVDAAERIGKVNSQLAKALEKSFENGESKHREEFFKYVSGNFEYGTRRHSHRPSSILKHTGMSLPLTPESKIKVTWDLMGMLALLYDMYTIPMQVFDIEDVHFFIACGWLILFYWTADIAVSFCSAYYDKDGEVKTSYRLIASRYARTWLLPDLFIVGIEWMFVFMKAYIGNMATNAASYARMSKFMRIARILRTVRMMRLAKLKDILYGLQHRIDSEWMSIAWGLITNVFILVTLNHATACGWVMIGNGKFGPTSWITYYDFSNAKRITKYLCALHWSLTLFTPASMNVHAVNDAERTYTVLNLILAMVIFASFVSSVTAGFTRLRHLEAESIKQRFMLKKFLKQNKVTIGLQARIVRYIDIARITHKKNVSYDHVLLLSWLSGPLKIELRKELCTPHLFLHPFWFGYYSTSHPAMNEVCIAACSFVALSKGDTLFWRFSQSHNMCVVMSGSLVYRRATKLPSPKHVRLSAKSFFCEAPLWVNWVHHGSMKALIECDYLSIDCAKVREVSVCHHDVLKMACEYAKQFRAELQRTFITFGSAWDLPLDQISKTIVSVSVPNAHEVSKAEQVEAELIQWSDEEFSDADVEEEEEAKGGGDPAEVQPSTRQSSPTPMAASSAITVEIKDGQRSMML